MTSRNFMHFLVQDTIELSLLSPVKGLDQFLDSLLDQGDFKVLYRARRYTADEYIALLDTFSGHIAMGPAKREHLYREIHRRLAARPDSRLTCH